LQSSNSISTLQPSPIANEPTSVYAGHSHAYYTCIHSLLVNSRTSHPRHPINPLSRAPSLLLTFPPFERPLHCCARWRTRRADEYTGDPTSRSQSGIARVERCRLNALPQRRQRAARRESHVTSCLEFVFGPRASSGLCSVLHPHPSDDPLRTNHVRANDYLPANPTAVCLAWSGAERCWAERRMRRGGRWQSVRPPEGVAQRSKTFCAQLCPIRYSRVNGSKGSVDDGIVY
jgi:hypothetical protein